MQGIVDYCGVGDEERKERRKERKKETMEEKASGSTPRPRGAWPIRWSRHSRRHGAAVLAPLATQPGPRDNI